MVSPVSSMFPFPIKEFPREYIKEPVFVHRMWCALDTFCFDIVIGHNLFKRFFFRSS